MSDRHASHSRTARPPLDQAGLERLALHYVARYATTSAKLRDYLQRKCRERETVGSTDVAALVAKIVEMQFVDDAAFATSRAASLARKGYGARRIGLALRQAGIDADTANEVLTAAPLSGVESAQRYAQRRRLGPYSGLTPSKESRQRAIAALLRAGHSFDDAREALNGWRSDEEEF